MFVVVVERFLQILRKGSERSSEQGTKRLAISLARSNWPICVCAVDFLLPFASLHISNASPFGHRWR